MRRKPIKKVRSCVSDIVIIGAGLSGMCAAYALEQAGFYNYTLYEQAERPGGLLKSEKIDGFTFDHTGHWVHISDPLFKDFIDRVSGLESYSKHARNAHVYSSDTLTPYPFQMHLHGLPLSVIAECIEGFVKRKTKLNDPQNFKQWVLKHFGAGFGKYFFYDYNSKILSYPVNKIHPAWTGRFVPQTTLEQILAGSLAPKESSSAGYNSSFYYPLDGGIEFLITSIRQSLKNPVVTQARAQHINIDTQEIWFEDGKKTRFNYLISTIPLNNLLTISQSARINTEPLAKKLLCNSVVNINIGFKKDLGIASDWIYFPEKKYPFYRLGFWHNIAPQLVPNGSSGVYGEFSFIKNSTSTSKISQKTDEVLAKMLSFLKVSENDICVRKDLLLNHAYVIYDAWRQDNIDTILKTLAAENILSTGRYGEWKYSSMQEAFQDGAAAAEKALKKVRVQIETNTPPKFVHIPF